MGQRAGCACSSARMSPVAHRRAVERELEVIGEALSRLTMTDSGVAARISHLPRIVGFRNRIIHGYDAIDDATVWGVSRATCPRWWLKWSDC